MVQLLAVLALICFLIGIFCICIVKVRSHKRCSCRQAKYIYTKSTKQRSKKKWGAAALAVVLLLGGTAYAYQIYQNYQNKTQDEEMPPLPSIDPVRSIEDLYPDFKLSRVNGSAMLNLINILIGEKGVSADAVKEGVDQLRTFLEQARASGVYSFPEYLKLPEGEVNYAFDTVKSVEDCVKQMRALDKQLRLLLENVQLNELDREKIAEKSKKLTIRGKDALFFGYPQGRNGKSIITEEETWLYAEYIFFGIVNEYIYGECPPAKSLDMYYRLMQTFDYLGGIADTEELRLEMDFIALICGECAIEEWGNQGWIQADSVYGTAIWRYYRDMIYRVALAVNAKREDPSGFYTLIQTVDEKLDEAQENSLLSEAEVKNIKSTFKESKLYDQWKENYERKEEQFQTPAS